MHVTRDAENTSDGLDARREHGTDFFPRPPGEAQPC